MMGNEYLEEYYNSQLQDLREKRKALRQTMNENKKQYKEIEKEIREIEESLASLK